MLSSEQHRRIVEKESTGNVADGTRGKQSIKRGPLQGMCAALFRRENLLKPHGSFETVDASHLGAFDVSDSSLAPRLATTKTIFPRNSPTGGYQ